MAPSADLSNSPPDASTENKFQPFFILHKASPPRKYAAKSRRKIELSPKCVDGSSERYNENVRFETFRSSWSKTESCIKEVSRNFNVNTFDKIDKWIHESFDAICACRKMYATSVTCPYPFINNESISDSVASHQIYTAWLFTKNMEFVDDILTFVDLGAHLKSSGCYVANLTSLEFTEKNGVGGCVKSLLRQFLTFSVDAPDISILASWYVEQGDDANPMIVIIDDVERCCASVFSDFITMLREWLVKIPIILVLGVATTVDILRSTLPSNACSFLSISEFSLGTPAERMNAVIESILVKQCETFGIGKQVSTFLRNYFLRHDGTLTFFLRALKIAMVQHVYREPLSSTRTKYGEEDDIKSNACLDDSASGLSTFKRLRKIWSSLMMCLYEVGKYNKISILDLYCDMIEPELCNSSDQFQLSKADKSKSSYNQHVVGCLKKGSCVHQVIQIVRALPTVELSKLLKSWITHTSGITEFHEKIMELQSLKIVDRNQLRHHTSDASDASKKLTDRSNANKNMDETKIKENFVSFLEYAVRECKQPTESISLSAQFLFNNVDKLQAALIGDPRRRIQADLLEFHKFLKCSCCNKSDGLPLSSMHDTSIMYSLAQEHGDLINVNEWFHSFKAIVVSQPPLQAKKRLKSSPSPKKRKERVEPKAKSDASVQAEFCRAVTELQITGLIRMPSKRRPDYVQRVAFGL